MRTIQGPLIGVRRVQSLTVVDHLAVRVALRGGHVVEGLHINQIEPHILALLSLSFAIPNEISNVCVRKIRDGISARCIIRQSLFFKLTEKKVLLYQQNHLVK